MFDEYQNYIIKICQKGFYLFSFRNLTRAMKRFHSFPFSFCFICTTNARSTPPEISRHNVTKCRKREQRLSGCRLKLIDQNL